MSDSATIRAVLRAHIDDAASQWNLGTFGAIAEFIRDPGEAVAITDQPERLAAVTERGGIGFDALDGIRLFASESAVGTSWSHRVALCLPDEASAMNRRTALTELGPDTQALRAEDADGILFDMGLGTLQADICIRTGDPELISLLRAQSGRSLFEAGNPAMPAIVASGPHRVFLARIGRCEVYQPIPPAGGKSPEGPHTHVLPQLLRSGRTHAATEPVPEGFVPCAHLVPAHPVRDAMGHPRAFDAIAQNSCESLLARFGDPTLSAVKQALRKAVADGASPETFAAPATKFERHALRVALRQIAAAAPETPQLAGWLAWHEARERGAETETDPYAH